MFNFWRTQWISPINYVNISPHLIGLLWLSKFPLTVCACVCVCRCWVRRWMRSRLLCFPTLKRPPHRPVTLLPPWLLINRGGVESGALLLCSQRPADVPLRVDFRGMMQAHPGRGWKESSSSIKDTWGAEGQRDRGTACLCFTVTHSNVPVQMIHYACSNNFCSTLGEQISIK